LTRPSLRNLADKLRNVGEYLRNAIDLDPGFALA